MRSARTATHKLGRIAGRMATNDGPEAAPCASHVEHASAPSMTGSVGAIVRAQALARGYIARARATRAHVRDGNVEEHALEQAAVRAVRRASRPGAVAVGAAGGTRTRNGAFTSCSHADCVGRAHAAWPCQCLGGNAWPCLSCGVSPAHWCHCTPLVVPVGHPRTHRPPCTRRHGATIRHGRHASAERLRRRGVDVPSHSGSGHCAVQRVQSSAPTACQVRWRSGTRGGCGRVAFAAHPTLCGPRCAPSVCVQVRAAATAGVEQNPGAGQRSQAVRAAWAAADHRGGPAWPV